MTSTTLRVGQVTILCDVADTLPKQIKGLQGRQELALGRGLLFPFPSTRRATMHMGSVSFPIDILFIRNGRIARIVHDAQPGETSLWTDTASSILELPGGFALSYGIAVGDKIDTSLSKLGQTIEDPDEFAAGILIAFAEAIARDDALSWRPDVLNGNKTESSVVTSNVIKKWLSTLGVSDLQTVVNAATSSEGFETISELLIQLGIIDFSRVSPDGQNLILYRTPKKQPPRLSI